MRLVILAASLAILATLGAVEGYDMGCDVCARHGVSDGACGVCR